MTNMTLVKHIHTYKHSIVIFIIQRKKLSYLNIHVHTYMHDLPSNTSLHYHHVSTYASKDVHILIFRHAWHQHGI